MLVSAPPVSVPPLCVVEPPAFAVPPEASGCPALLGAAPPAVVPAETSPPDAAGLSVDVDPPLPEPLTVDEVAAAELAGAEVLEDAAAPATALDPPGLSPSEPPELHAGKSPQTSIPYPTARARPKRPESFTNHIVAQHYETVGFFLTLLPWLSCGKSRRQPLGHPAANPVQNDLAFVLRDCQARLGRWHQTFEERGADRIFPARHMVIAREWPLLSTAVMTAEASLLDDRSHVSVDRRRRGAGGGGLGRALQTFGLARKLELDGKLGLVAG